VKQSEEFEGNCFAKSKLTLVSLDNKKATFELEAREPRSLTCSDSFLLGTSKYQHYFTIYTKGVHKVTLTNLTDDDVNEVKGSGFRLLGFCQNGLKSLESLYKTARLYLGGFSTKHAHIPKEMEKANLDFIKRYVGLDFESRGDFGKIILNYKKEDIKTGDFLAIVRLDGLD